MFHCFHCFTVFTHRYIQLISTALFIASSVLLYKLYKYCIIHFIRAASFSASVLYYLFHSTTLFNASVLNHSLHQYFCSGMLLVFIWIAFLLDNIYLKHHYVSRLWHNETKVGSFVSFPTLAQ